MNNNKLFLAKPYLVVCRINNVCYSKEITIYNFFCIALHGYFKLNIFNEF